MAYRLEYRYTVGLVDDKDNVHYVHFRTAASADNFFGAMKRMGAKGVEIFDTEHEVVRKHYGCEVPS